MTIDVVEDVAALRRRLASAPAPIGLVPTMGALHEGHVSLVDAARGDCETVVVSIFVNPLQFGPSEDFDRYPRTLSKDLQRLEAAGVDCVFAPVRAAFTPPGARTTVSVRDLTARLEGASRPGHFDGVTTIVAKLLSAVGPQRAYFGEKDFQQLAVVRQMVRDLNLPVEIIGCPIVRDAHGLALSSRNRYLDDDQRQNALALSRALRELAADYDGNADAARTWLTSRLSSASGVRLDYAEIVDPETLTPLEGVTAGPAQALVAAFVGDTRLIDNIRLEPKPGHGLA